MKLEEAAARYGTGSPGKAAAMRRIVLSLKREKIETLEQLEERYDKNPPAFLKIRGIGPKSMELMTEFLEFFRTAERNQTGEEE